MLFDRVNLHDFSALISSSNYRPIAYGFSVSIHDATISSSCPYVCLFSLGLPTFFFSLFFFVFVDARTSCWQQQKKTEPRKDGKNDGARSRKRKT